MTARTGAAGTGAGGVARVPAEAVPVQALQAALATEHAAIWAYGVIDAILDGAGGRADLAALLAEAVAAHRARRDATERLLLDAGAEPVPAEPGYVPPRPVTELPSAVRLAVTAETDAAAAWRSVIERGPAEPTVRRAALDALTGCAVRATRWRAAAGSDPATVPFPGAP